METFLTILIISITLYLLYSLYKLATRPQAIKGRAEYKAKQALEKSSLTDLVSENGNCPRCECQEWKQASLVNAEGLSNISTSTIGAGAGIANNLLGESSGFGAGFGKTNGAQQTELSELAAPPEKKMRPSTAFLILGLVVFVLSFVFTWGFGIFFSLIIIIISIFRMATTLEISKKLDDEHKQALLTYQLKRMCLRCGTFYIFSNDKKSLATSPDLNNSEIKLTETKKCPFCAETILSEAVLCKHCHSKI